MIARKKDLPTQFHGIWYAGVLNLAVCFINLAIYYSLNGSIITLMCACVSLVGGTAMLILAKYLTQKMIWNNLTRGVVNTSELELR